MSQLPFIPDEPKPGDFSARFERYTPRTLAVRHYPRRHHGRSALVLLAAVAVPALAAPGDWSGFDIGNAGKAEVAVQPMPFEENGESFPGSAFYYLADDGAAKSPSLGEGIHSDADGAPGPVARALRVDNSGVDRSRALQCLTAAIYYEAASEPDAGQRAVAQVVLNRVAHPAFPKTVCGVVYQGSERSSGCQFSFTCDGSLARKPSRMFWDRAMGVARAALAGFVYKPVGLATHYHTIQVHPYWADSLSLLNTIGAHRFYALRGRGGAEATFRFAYSGGEPVAAPHVGTGGGASADPSLDPLALQRAFDNASAQARNDSAQTDLAPVGEMAPQARDALPQANGIREEYRNSGTWIARPGG